MTQLDYFELERVGKKFVETVAIDDLSLRLGEPSIVGLVGRNGSGKTTLLRLVAGLVLPTRGRCTTFGVDTVDLGASEYARLGMSHQHDPLIGWMTARRLIRYVASFHESWDAALEQQLIELLEIDVSRRVDTMSPGNRQKLSLALAVCHRPSLLLLDEPLSDLDPVVRRDVLATLLERFRHDRVAIVLSSHLLHDLERIADRIVCVDRGRLVVDTSLDALVESFAEWTVSSADGTLPVPFTDHFIVAQRGDAFQAHLTVRDPDRWLPSFYERYGIDIKATHLNLDRIFRLLVGAGDDGKGSAAPRRDAAAVGA
jgi:ABC-2 type transport system ATP-binding protein